MDTRHHMHIKDPMLFVILPVIVFIVAGIALVLTNKAQKSGILTETAFVKPQEAHAIITASADEQKEGETKVIIDEDTALAGSVEDAVGQALNGASALVNETFIIINEKRQQQGLPQLTWDMDLGYAADLRAKEIVTHFSDVRPDGTAWYSVDSKQEAENVAKEFKKAKDTVNSWMASPTHKANILNPEYTIVGVGIYEQNKQLYWAVEFGK